MKKSLCVSLIIFSLTSLTFSQNIINDGGGKPPRDAMCMLYLGEGTVRVIEDQKSKITLPKTVPPGTTIEELMATAIGIGIIRLGLDISDELVKAVLIVMDAHPDFTPAEIVREVEVLFVNQEKIDLAKDGATPEPFDLREKFIARSIITGISMELREKRITEILSNTDAVRAALKLPHRPLLQQIGHVLDAAESIHSRNAFFIAQYLNEAENFVPLDVAQVQRILNAEDNAFRGVPNVPNTRVTITDVLACLEIEMVRDAQINFIMEGTEVTAEAIDRYFIEKNLIVHWETALGSKRINAILGMSHDLSPAKQVKTVLATQIYLNKIQFAYPNNRALAIAIREVLLGVKFKFLSKADQNLSVEKIERILEIKKTLEREGRVISIRAIADRVSRPTDSRGSSEGGGHVVDFSMQGIVANGDGELVMPMPTVGDVLRSKLCRAGQRALKAIGIRRGELAAVEDPWKGREKERTFLREHIGGREIRR